MLLTVVGDVLLEVSSLNKNPIVYSHCRGQLISLSLDEFYAKNGVF